MSRCKNKKRGCGQDNSPFLLLLFLILLLCGCSGKVNGQVFNEQANEVE